MAKPIALAQTPEGRRRTRNHVVTALVAVALVAGWALTQSIDMVSNSDTAAGKQVRNRSLLHFNLAV